MAWNSLSLEAARYIFSPLNIVLDKDDEGIYVATYGSNKLQSVTLRGLCNKISENWLTVKVAS